VGRVVDAWVTFFALNEPHTLKGIEREILKAFLKKRSCDQAIPANQIRNELGRSGRLHLNRGLTESPS